MSRARALNQAVLTENQTFISNSIAAATPTGSTDTAVLVFAGGPTVPVGSTGWPYANSTNTAAGGTVVRINQSGLYEIDFQLAFTGAVAVAAGIGINMAAAPITADPVVGTDGVIKAADMLMVAVSTQAWAPKTRIVVTQAQARALDSLNVQGLTIRFLATNSGGAAPVGVVVASVAYRVNKLAKVAF